METNDMTHDSHTNDPHVRMALERSRARRHDAEHQLRALRGTAQRARLAELDSLLAYEVQLETRLTQLLDRELTGTSC
jgi:hypothetical protein